MSKPNLSNMSVTELLDLRNEIDSAIRSNVDLLQSKESLNQLDKEYFKYEIVEEIQEVYVYYLAEVVFSPVIACLDLRDDYLEQKIDALNRNKVEIGKFLKMSTSIAQNLVTIGYAFSSVFYLKDSNDDFMLRVNDGHSARRCDIGEVSVKLDNTAQVSVTRFMRNPFVVKIEAGDRATYLRSDRQGDHLDLQTSFTSKVEDYFREDIVKEVMSVAKELNKTYEEITFVVNEA